MNNAADDKEIRNLLSQITATEIDESVTVFTPLHINYGKHTKIGKNVSGGEPRNVASPDINTEDFSAAVDFLGLQKNVDRSKIGIIGICGFGGFALNATAVDKRIKAVVASTMYDMTRVMSKGYNDAVTLKQCNSLNTASFFRSYIQPIQCPNNSMLSPTLPA